MSLSNPDNNDVMRALEKMQKQLDDIQKRSQDSQRLFSPEHIAQMSGYVQIKSDLNEIQKTLNVILSRIGNRV